MATAAKQQGKLDTERRRLNQALDRLELRLQALEEEIEQACRDLQAMVPTAKIQFRYVRCGKKGCRCTEGRGHGPYAYASEKVGGKVRTRYLGKEPKLPKGAVDKRTYRLFVKRLEELRREREKIFDRIARALEHLR